MVDDADLVTLFHELQWLIDVLHFVVMRMRLAVGSNQAIEAEGSVVGFVSEVATIEEPTPSSSVARSALPLS